MKEKGEQSDLEKSLAARLRTTIAPSGLPYSESWVCGQLELHDELSFDAALTSNFADSSDLSDSKMVLGEKEATKATLQAELAALKLGR